MKPDETLREKRPLMERLFYMTCVDGVEVDCTPDDQLALLHAQSHRRVVAADAVVSIVLAWMPIAQTVQRTDHWRTVITGDDTPMVTKSIGPFATTAQRYERDHEAGIDVGYDPDEPNDPETAQG